MSMFWTDTNRLRQTIADADRAIGDIAASNPAAAAKLRDYTHDLEERVDKLGLVCMAMWSLMRQQTGLSEEDLMRRVKEIDLVDGQADGRITPTVARCPACNRVMSPRHTRCLYCGTNKLQVTAFDTL